MNISIKRIVFICFVLFFLSIPQVGALEIISFDGHIQKNGDLDVTIQYELSSSEKLIVKTPFKSESKLISKTLDELGNDNEIISFDSGKVRVLISGFADVNQYGEYDTQPFWTDETIRDISLSFPDGWTYVKYNDNRVPQLIHKPDTTTALTFDSSGNEVTVYLKSPYVSDEQKNKLLNLLNTLNRKSYDVIVHEMEMSNEMDVRFFSDIMELNTDSLIKVFSFLKDSLSLAKSSPDITLDEFIVGKDMSYGEIHAFLNDKPLGAYELTTKEGDAFWGILRDENTFGVFRANAYEIGAGYLMNTISDYIGESTGIMMEDILVNTASSSHHSSTLNKIGSKQQNKNYLLLSDLNIYINENDLTEEQYIQIKNVVENRIAEMDSVTNVPLIDDFTYLPTKDYISIYDNAHNSVSGFKIVQSGIGLIQFGVGFATGGSAIAVTGWSTGLIDAYSSFTTNERISATYGLIYTNSLKSSAYRILKTGDITKSTYSTVYDIITKQHRPTFDPVEEIQGSFYSDIYSNTTTDYYVHIFFKEDELKRLLDQNNQKATIKAGYLFKNNGNYVLIAKTNEINKIPNNGEFDIHIEELFYGKPGNYDVSYVVEITTNTYNKIYTAPKNNINVKDYPLEVNFDFKYLPLETGNILSQGAVLTFKNTGSRQIIIDSVDEINGFAIYDSGTKHDINLQSDGFNLESHDEYNVYLDFPTVIFTPFPDAIKDYKVEAVYNVNGIGFTTTHESQ